MRDDDHLMVATGEGSSNDLRLWVRHSVHDEWFSLADGQAL